MPPPGPVGPVGPVSPVPVGPVGGAGSQGGRGEGGWHKFCATPGRPGTNLEAQVYVSTLSAQSGPISAPKGLGVARNLCHPLAPPAREGPQTVPILLLASPIVEAPFRWSGHD